MRLFSFGKRVSHCFLFFYNLVVSGLNCHSCSSQIVQLPQFSFLLSLPWVFLFHCCFSSLWRFFCTALFLLIKIIQWGPPLLYFMFKKKNRCNRVFSEHVKLCFLFKQETLYIKKTYFSLKQQTLILQWHQDCLLL